MKCLCATTAEGYNAAYPWFLPNFYFLRGIYAKLSERDEKTARKYFRASRELTTYIASSWGTQHVLEAISFLPVAWQQESVSAAFGGDPSVCEEWIAIIADSGRRPHAAIGGNRLSNRQIEDAYLKGLSIFAALNRPEVLRKTLHACLQHLESSYGDWLCAEPTRRKASRAESCRMNSGCCSSDNFCNLYTTGLPHSSDPALVGAGDAVGNNSEPTNGDGHRNRLGSPCETRSAVAVYRFLKR